MGLHIGLALLVTLLPLLLVTFSKTEHHVLNHIYLKQSYHTIAISAFSFLCGNRCSKRAMVHKIMGIITFTPFRAPDVTDMVMTLLTSG